VYVQLTTRDVGENLVPELRKILLGQITKSADFDPVRIDVAATVVAGTPPAWTEAWVDNATLPTKCVLQNGTGGWLQFEYKSFSIHYSKYNGSSGVDGTTTLFGTYICSGTDLVDNSLINIVDHCSPFSHKYEQSIPPVGYGWTWTYKTATTYPSIAVNNTTLTICASTNSLVILSNAPLEVTVDDMFATRAEWSSSEQRYYHSSVPNPTDIIIQPPRFFAAVSVFTDPACSVVKMVQLDTSCTCKFVNLDVPDTLVTPNRVVTVASVHYDPFAVYKPPVDNNYLYLLPLVFFQDATPIDLGEAGGIFITNSNHTFAATNNTATLDGVVYRALDPLGTHVRLLVREVRLLVRED